MHISFFAPVLTISVLPHAYPIVRFAWACPHYQHMSKMEGYQKTNAIRTIDASAKVLPMLLRDGRIEFLETVVLLLDPSKPLYNGSKTLWTNLPGAPEVWVYDCDGGMLRV